MNNQNLYNIPDSIRQAIADGALVVANNSGGKDSQAMLLKLRALVPADQLLVIHAVLPGVEWAGTEEHAREISKGLNYITVQAGKTFFDMVRSRGFWPSPKYRQCTSDLKRGPIEKAIRHAMKGRANQTVINCMGLRAQESSARAKTCGQPVKVSERNSKAGRNWIEWLPIADWTKDDVILEVKKAGQQLHWAYQHVSRLSCAFCIMGSKADLQAAARLNPEMFAQYVALEQEIGQSFAMPAKGQAPKFLPEYLEVAV
jgi:3'-phosphoadenosine 5'-phosphosulfate sulfotransferase (PAPS reductase)/FAD synthetase